MIKPAELLVITAISFGAATLQNTPAAALGIHPAQTTRLVAGSFAAVVAAQTTIAAATSRARTSSDCGLQGARERGRALSCS
jgi:hypothetical protein